MSLAAPAGSTPTAPASPATRPAHVRVSFIQAILVIWHREVIRFARDRTRLLVSLAQPLLYLLIFGVGLSASLGGGLGLPPGVTYLQYLYPGVLGMAVLFTAMFSAMSVVWDREFGFLREILVAPIRRSAVAVGKALGGATQAMVQGILLLVFAPVVGVKLSLVGVLELVPLLFVLAFALTSLGVALASRMRSLQAFQTVMTFLVLPMFFLSGALYPLRNLPGWMTVLTRLDPVAYGMAPIRDAVLDGAGVPAAVLDRFTGITIGSYTMPATLDVAVLLAFGAVFLGIAMRVLRRRG
ncbi:MAG TPA: ABC transporter permease [Actinomycetes bacterium]